MRPTGKCKPSLTHGPGRRMRSLCYFLLALVLAHPARSQNRPPPDTSRSLFSQSAVEILQRKFADSGASYLLLDANSETLLASHWENYERPIPLGSLVKPFTALAYANAHDFRYPVYECKGKASGCWQERPHGKLDFVTAVSVSCNSYFRRLAESVAAEQMDEVTRVFGLEPPEADFASASLIGLGEQCASLPFEWRTRIWNSSAGKSSPAWGQSWKE